jgi:signal peptidase II
MNKCKALPFSLTGLIILADQLVKAFIVKNWPNEGMFIADVFHNDFLWIIHVRNKAIAFSLGSNLPDVVRPTLFIILPLLVLGFLVWYYIRSNDFTRLQRWAVAGIIGGGLGNLIDRILRPAGVVDFISVKFLGLKGIPLLNWDRWPTFNIADASVVICGLMLLVSILVSPKRPSGTAG